MTDDSHISKPVQGNIEFIARAIIIDSGKILLCKPVDKNFYFLPGGHIEFGEHYEATLKREIIEELGVEASSVQPLGFVDNIYDDATAGFKRHEVNLIFEATLASKEIKPTEDHIRFEWIDFTMINATQILPVGVKKFLAQFLIDRK